MKNINVSRELLQQQIDLVYCHFNWAALQDDEESRLANGLFDFLAYLDTDEPEVTIKFTD